MMIRTANLDTATLQTRPSLCNSLDQIEAMETALMNRVELEAYVSEKTSIPKDVVSKIVGETMDAIVKSIEDGDAVKMVGYFTMTVKERPRRTGKNPRTGENIEIPESKRISFKPGKRLINAITS